MNKKKLAVIIIDILAIIAMIIIGLARVQSKSNDAQYGFDIAIQTQNKNIKSNQTIAIDLSVKDISMGEYGLNTIIANLEYDKSIFEDLKIIGLSDKNEWNVKKNQKQETIYFYSMIEGTNSNQRFARLELELKDNVEPQLTQIKLSNIKSSTGNDVVKISDKILNLRVNGYNNAHLDFAKYDLITTIMIVAIFVLIIINIWTFIEKKLIKIILTIIAIIIFILLFLVFDEGRCNGNKIDVVPVQEKISSESYVSIAGDYNNDGEFDVSDITNIIRDIIKVDELKVDGTNNNIDVDSDGDIDEEDVKQLLDIILNEIVEDTFNEDLNEDDNGDDNKPNEYNNDDNNKPNEDNNNDNSKPNEDNNNDNNKPNEDNNNDENKPNEDNNNDENKPSEDNNNDENEPNEDDNDENKPNEDNNNDENKLNDENQNIEEIIKVAYKIEHYTENLDGTYELKELENLTGEVNEKVIAKSKKYIGFTENTQHLERITEGLVNSDGSLVLKLYYTRNEYDLTVIAGEYITNVSGTGKYKYGQEIEIKADLESNPGYTYKNFRWETTGDISDKTSPITIIKMPSENLEVKASQERDTVKYNLKFNLDNGQTETENKNEFTVEDEEFTVINPTRKGYTFTGWTGTDITTPIQTLIITNGATGDREYTANWSINEYTITYNLNNGTIEGTNPEKYTVETEDIIVINPSKQGYTFIGWTGTELENPTKDLIIQRGSIENREYTANWKANKDTKYKVEHYIEELDGNYTLKETDNLEGETEGVVTAVAKDYTGFTENQTNENRLAEGTIKPDGSLVLKLYYSRNEYDLTVTAGEYITNVIGTGKYKYEQEVEITANLENLPGYTYSNFRWETKDVTILANSTEIITKIIVPAKNTEVVAKQERTINEYAISYNLNDGTVEGTNPEKYTVETENIILVNPNKQGYTFIGWTGTDLAELTQTVTIQKGTTGNKEYIANWEANKDTPYKVEHYIEELDGTYTLKETENLQGETGIDVFADFHVDSGFTENRAHPDRIEYGTIKPDGSLVLKMYYSRKEYDLTVVAGNYITSVTGSGKYKYEQEVEITAEKENLPGYTYTNFKWDKTEFAKIENSKETTTKVTIPANNLKVIASQERTVNEYIISYNLNDGIVEGTNPEKYTVETENITLINPTKQGYTFIGWTGTDIQTPVETVVIEKGTIGNKEYTANWRENGDTPYKVEHYKEQLDGNYIIENETYIENLTSATNIEVIATALILEGYTENTEHKDRVEKGNVKPDGSLILKLYYSRNEYDLTVTSGDNILTTTGTGKYKYGQEVEIKAELENKQGYTYSNFRWETQNPTILTNTTELTTKVTIPAGNVEVIAKQDRTVNEYTISYNLNNGTVEGTNPEKYTVETEDITLINPTKQGYTFTGWTGTELEQLTKTVVIPKGSIENREYTANWKANENTPYKVEHYIEELDGTYKLKETDDLEGETEIDVFADIYMYPGFTENRTHPDRIEYGTIKPDGSLVLKIYYSRNEYELTVTAGNYITSVTGSGKYKYEQEVEITAEKENLPGYTYSNFKWDKKELANIENTTETITKVKIPANNLEVIASQERTINEYTISYNLNNGTVEETNPEKYTVETENITLINPTKTGYTFTGWTGTDLSELTQTVTIPKGSTGNKEYIANWETNKDTAYKVEYYIEELDGTYTLKESEDLQGETEIDVIADIYMYPGFTENRTHPDRIEYGTIKPDGSLVLKIYYSRNEYDLTVTAGNYITNVTGSGKYKYEQEVEITAEKENLPGYTYSNFEWETVDPTIITNTKETTTKVKVPANDVEVKAKQERIINEYTISYNLNDGIVEGTNPEKYTIETENITLINPSKPGYKFTGWTGTDLTEKTNTVVIEKGSLGNKEYTANWEPNKLTINYYSNNATESFDNALNQVAEGKNVLVFTFDVAYDAGVRENGLHDYTLEESSLYLARTGYKATGNWGTEPTGGIIVNQSTSWESTESFANLVGKSLQTGNATINLYPIWESNKDTVYKVEHYIEELDGTYTLKETDKLSGETETTATAVAKGYTGFTENLIHSDRMPSGTINADGSLVLKLYYSRNEYDLTVTAGNYITNTTGTGKYKYEQEVEITAEKENLPGYTYSNFEWETVDPTIITNTKETTTKVKVPANNVEVKAKQERIAKEYTISYNLNNGTIAGNNPEKYTVETEDITLINPNKEGYIFTGWTGTDLTELTLNVVIPKGSLENREYTANWVEVVASTTINSVTTNYASVQEAIDAAGENSGAIVTLLKNEITESVTVAEGQDIVLDTNNKELSNTTTNTIKILGKLTIIGEGTINGATDVPTILNQGTESLTILSSTINASGEWAIYGENGCKIIIGEEGNNSIVSPNITGGVTGRTADIYMHSGIVTATTGEALNCRNIITVTGGYLKSSNTHVAPVIWGTTSDAVITITGGIIEQTQQICAINTGIDVKGTKINISGGKIIANLDIAINNRDGDTVITGGEIIGAKGVLSNEGNVKVTGGTIRGTTHGIYSLGAGNVEISGTAEISGEIGVFTFGAGNTIVKDTPVIIGTNDIGLWVKTGYGVITGGTIIGETRGIYAQTGSIVIGDNSNEVSTTVPRIFGKQMGISLDDNIQAFNFYDGIIIGNDSISGIEYPTEVPNGYCVVNGTETIEDVTYETSILKQQYKIEYNSNGEETPPLTQYKIHDEDLILSSDVLCRDYYVFKGWATTPNATTPEYLPGTIYTANASETLYAVWVDAIASTKVGESTTFYDTVQSAIDAAGTNEATVTLLKDEILENVTIAQSQKITLDVNGKTLKNLTAYYTVINTGELTIVGDGLIDGDSERATIKSRDGGITILDCDCTIKATNRYTISNESIVIVENATIIGENTYGIYNYPNHSVEINGGVIQGIKSGVCNYGNLEITGGSIRGTESGIHNNGNLTITGGIIEGNSAIRMESQNGVLTLGINEENPQVNITEPTIIGSLKGVYNITNTTFNFYDGIIKAPQDSTIVGTVTNLPTGYQIVNGLETIDEVEYETAYLVPTNGIATTKIGQEVTYYQTVQEAINAAGTNEGATVTLLKDEITESVTIAENQNIIFDLNGKTLTNSGKPTLYNHGTVNVIGDGEIQGKGGNLIHTVTNYGTFIKDGPSTISNTNTATNYAVHNESTGTFILNEGTISSADRGMYNESVIIINGGNVESVDYGIYNDSSVTTEENPSIKITGGTLNSQNESGIYNNLNGTVVVTGGNITGKDGIYNISNGKIIVGTNEENPQVSITEPCITATNIGIRVNTGTLDFYDGIIKGATGKSISGTVSSKPLQHIVEKGTETIDETTYETAYLVFGGVASTTIGESTIVYETVQEAINAAGTNEGAKVTLLKNEITESVTIAENQNLIFDLNGKTLKYSTTPTVYNYGTTTIVGDGEISGSGGSSIHTITNHGTLIKDGNGILSNTSTSGNYVIHNKSTGTFTLNEGTITSKDRGIYNETATASNGAVIINGGVINTTDYSIYNDSALALETTPSVKINGGEITSKDIVAVYNNKSGRVEIGNATIVGQTYGVQNNSTGTVIVNGANIKGVTLWGIYNAASSATITIYDGYIEGEVHGVGSASAAKTTFNIYGGTLKGYVSDGLATGAGVITIGIDDGNVSTTTPHIEGKRYGINKNSTSAKVYFNDGIIISNTSTSLYGGVTGTATGHAVNTVTNEGGGQTSTLTPIYSEYDSQGNFVKAYSTLATAFEGATSGNTIKPQKTLTEKVAPTLPADKTIILDMNNQTLTLSGVSLTNNGNLQITGEGSLINTKSNTIKNNGTLSIEEGITVTGVTTYVSGATGAESTIDNYGNLTLNGGTIIAKSADAIFNESTGKITINDGIIEGNKAILRNFGTANTEEDPSVKILGGTLTAKTANGITNKSSGLLYIAGGTITSKQTLEHPTIYNETGKVKITGGTIISETERAVSNYYEEGYIEITGGIITGEYAIQNNGTMVITGGIMEGTSGSGVINNATLTLGNDDGTISIDSPKLIGTPHGINNKSIFNFYDGIIEGDKSSSILGTVTDKPDATEVYKLTIDNQEFAYLVNENVKASYTVEHYIEKTDGTYELKETENLSDTPGKEVTAIAKQYETYTENQEHSERYATGTVMPDGSLVLKLYYTRNSYELTLVKGDYIESVTGSGSYKFGDIVEITAVAENNEEYTYSNFKWEVPEDVTIEDANEKTTKIIMPAKAIEIIAKQERTAKEYTITYDLADGTVSGTNPEKYTVESDEITLINPTREMYVFKGWTGTDLTDLTTTVTIPKGSTGNREYTANWEEAVAMTTENEINTYHLTVQSAIDEVDQTGKVTLLKDRNINQTDRTAKFGADKTIELELNNKTLTVTEINSFVNYGTLTINGTGTIRGENIEESNINYIISNSGGNLTLNSNVLATSSRGVIFSSGNLDINGATIMCTSDSNYAISNKGNLNLNSGIINSTFSGIYNNGTLELNGGTISTEHFGINNLETSTIEFNSGKIIVSTASASEIIGIYNSSTKDNAIVMNGGEIIAEAKGSGYAVGINSNSSGNINIVNGTIDISAKDHYALGINNIETGDVKIESGSTIIAKSTNNFTRGIVTYRGNVNINGASITAIGGGSTGSYGVFSYADKANTTADISVIGGSIIGQVASGSGNAVGIGLSLNSNVENVSNATTLNISGGANIKGISDSGIAFGIHNLSSSGNISINGANISANSNTGREDGINNKGNNELIITGTVSTPTIINETLTSTDKTGHGIYQSGGKLTLTNGYTIENSIGIEYPFVKGSKYGVYVTNGCEFNFYDGLLEGTNELAIYGTVTNKPNSAEIRKETVEDRQKAYLYNPDAINNYGIIYNLDGGIVDGENPTIFTAETEEFTLINPTKQGYTFTGWTGTGLTELTKTVTIPKGSTGSRTYTANWAEAYYYNQTSNNYYVTLNEAINASPNNSTISVIKNANETITPTVETGKNLVLDLSDKTVMLKGVSLTNNGTLKITGESGTLKSTIQTIDNKTTGILNKEGNCTITGSGQFSTIYNSGKMTLTEGLITSDVYGGIYNQNPGQVIVNGGKIETPKVSINTWSNVNTENLENVEITEKEFAVLINDGEIKSETANAITNYSEGGVVCVNGGYIYSSQTEDMPTIYNETGVIKVLAGTIISENDRAVCNYKTEETTGDENEINGGEIIITGGELIGKVGVQNFENSTLTIGTDDNDVSTSSPIIRGKECGVINAGNMNFYDGVIKGKTDSISNTDGVKINVPKEWEISYNSETITEEGKQENYEVATLVSLMKCTITYYDGTKLLGTSGYNPETDFSLVKMSDLGGSKDGFTFTGWALSENSTEIDFEDGASLFFYMDDDIDLYAVWQRDAIFYSGENLEVSDKKVQYYNPKGGNYSVEAPIQKEISGWRAKGWREDTVAATNQIPTSNIITSSASKFYGVYERDIIFNSGSGNTTIQKVTQYYNSNNSKSEITMLTPAEVPGWTVDGWRYNTASEAKIYSVGQTLTPVAQTTYYAVYSRNIQFISGVDSATTRTAVQYLNSTNTKSAVVMQTPMAIDSWTALGWRDDTSIADKEYEIGATVTPVSITKYYAVYSRDITLKYDPNGGTGSIADQTTKQFYNTNGGLSTPTFTLKANTFTRTNYVFSKWTDETTNAVQYSPGEIYNKFVPAAANPTTIRKIYAVWKEEE